MTTRPLLRMHAGRGRLRLALDDVGITEQPLRGVLHDYFAWSTDRMGRTRLPDTVPTTSAPHWDWDGPVSR